MITPEDPNEDEVVKLRQFLTVYMTIGIIIDLHRIYVAVNKPSTRSIQFAFNLWLIGAAVFYFGIVYAETLNYYVPLPKGGVHPTTNSTAETETASTKDQQEQPLLPSSSRQTLSLLEIKYWIECGLHLVLGLGLKAILNQKRQLDLEREEHQRYDHYLLVSSDKELPTPVASASTVDGFMTEADVGRLRLRVPTWPRLFMAIWFLWLTYSGVNRILQLSSEHPLTAREYSQLAISLTQGVGGLYILYRKSLVLTQWLFYSLCVTTVHQTLDTSMTIWNEDFNKLFAESGLIYGKEELIHCRLTIMTGTVLFYVWRLWVTWRLVADLKARNARVAGATGAICRREVSVEKQNDVDDIAIKVVDKKATH
ncbi:hypothetical protein BGZ96_004820 [Linnemannia gamsii]|uniref:TLC domain-containing protein n=1 Tax=Linnemannia gamsii TaxID=64522 RepID=A0ABQ7JHT3_9FUNG|nr:hypothetical protein BGZ96_004820 [Linnemannia gamsii]